MIARVRIKAIAGLVVTVFLSSVMGIFTASAETVDTFIRQLKDPSPDVRVRAVRELCAG